jgi:hypothetical protein
MIECSICFDEKKKIKRLSCKNHYCCKDCLNQYIKINKLKNNSNKCFICFSRNQNQNVININYDDIANVLPYETYFVLHNENFNCNYCIYLKCFIVIFYISICILLLLCTRF